MTPIAICVAAFAAAYLAGRRSLWQGIAVVLAVGYAYGILRANAGGATHLVFDAAVAGLFAAQLWKVARATDRPGLYALKCWTFASERVCAFPAAASLNRVCPRTENAAQHGVRRGGHVGERVQPERVQLSFGDGPDAGEFAYG